MTLTKKEKELLDKAIFENLDVVLNIPMHSSSLAEKINLPVGFGLLTNTSIKYSIERLRKTKNLNLYCRINIHHQIIIESGTPLHFNIKTFRKEKNLIFFDCADNNLLYYDFNTKKFNRTDFSGFWEYFSPTIRDSFNYEWLFNYTNDINIIKSITANLPDELIKEMPKGYYLDLQTNPLSCANLMKYCYIQKYGKYWKFVESNFNPTELKKLDIFLEKYSFNTLDTLIKLEMLNGNFVNATQIRYLISTYAYLKNKGRNVVIDKNRDISTNIEELKNLRDSLINQDLSEALQTINFINNTIINEKYLVIVPQTLEDLQEEGRQQHNCVGHYYNESIRNLENFICFLRLKDNPSHSYITCRYSVGFGLIAEARYVNNYDVRDRDDRKAINELSALIKKGLNKAEL